MNEEDSCKCVFQDLISSYDREEKFALQDNPDISQCFHNAISNECNLNIKY